MCDASTLNAMYEGGKDFSDDAKDKNYNFSKMWNEGMGGTNWQNRLGGQYDETWGGGNWMDQMGRREFNEAWGKGNWMRRLGMDPSVFDPQGGSSDSSSIGNMTTIFDQTTAGAGGKNRKAKIASNQGTSVGKKKLTIKPKYS
tara:strand:+ start:2672 stop:3100 length:429 start_codon:yes stop_codon:yes gene_type:complete